MKKKLAAISFIFALAFVFAACNDTISTTEGFDRFFKNLSETTNYTIKANIKEKSNPDGKTAIESIMYFLAKRDGDKIYMKSGMTYKTSNKNDETMDKTGEYYLEKYSDKYYRYEKDDNGKWTKKEVGEYALAGFLETIGVDEYASFTSEDFEYDNAKKSFVPKKDSQYYKTYQSAKIKITNDKLILSSKDNEDTWNAEAKITIEIGGVKITLPAHTG